jgi:sucrose phosphorylase
MRNGVQLIAYVDRLGGGGISTVRELLTGPLEGVFTGVHLLPFSTPYDGADAGFDPVDHSSVDPRLGTWADVAALAATHDITADLIVNHISDESPEFRDFLENGDTSPYAGMFLERDDVFQGGATDEELAAIHRPRPTDPFTTVETADGSRRTMWTTFTPHQIDIDVSDPTARRYLSNVLGRFTDARVAQVRLDAVGYAVKTRGTSCFMTPDTYAFIDELCTEVSDKGMTSLLEIHSHYLDQVSMAKRVDRVYDFALPPLILHALSTGSARHLERWLAISPRNAITVLDTHDGIGVVDVGPAAGLRGLLSGDDIDGLVDGIHTSTHGESLRATGASASNLDLYQVNSTYYSAVGCDDNLYLIARLIQFLAPGIPQVYYAGLLAARNDMALLEATGVGRDINRPHYTVSQIAARLRQPVVRHLMDMARWRNTHPAFGGEFHLGTISDSELLVGWASDRDSVMARINLATATFAIDDTWGATTRTITDWTEF